MQKIILLYIGVLLVFFGIGVIVALIKFYSWWYIFLVSFPISFGWYPISEITKKMSEHVDGSCALFFLSFILEVGLLLYGAKTIDAISFLGIVLAVGLFGSIIITAILMLKLRASMICNV